MEERQSTKAELMKYIRKSGCASKISPGDLHNALCGLDVPKDANTLIGIESFEDAGVYKISEDLALVQTIDFSTPTVNDPYMFGQITAANALSDVYAMGAIPKTALNIVGYSMSNFGSQTLKEILRGGIDKLREAGVSLLGGHSVDDIETKYGLSVTGFVHPEKIVLNRGARPGDYLILTKPVGNGIVSTGIKEGVVDEADVRDMIAVMASLNKEASEVMITARAHAATDVTGFGLIGHLKEMIEEDVGVELSMTSIPCFAKTVELVLKGIFPGGLEKNRAFYEADVIGAKNGPMEKIIYDPQTSGGLLIAVSSNNMDMFRRAAETSELDYWVIGRFVKKPRGKIILQ